MVDQYEAILMAVEHLDFLAAKAGKLSDEINELRSALIATQYQLTKNMFSKGAGND